MRGWLKLLKLLKWQLDSRQGRFTTLAWLFGEIPGEFGIEIRKKLYSKYFKKVGANLRIHPGIKIRNIEQLSLGDNVGLGDDCFIQAAGEIEISDSVVLGPGVKIWSANHIFRKDAPVNKSDYEYKKVILGKNVWVGANAFIMPGCELGEGSVVSAGSVVGGKKYPPFSVLAGNPARMIKKVT